MIDKLGLRCFHQAKFMLMDHDHHQFSNEVIQFHHVVQLALLKYQKLFELPFDMESTGIAVEELFVVTLFVELA